MPDGSVNLDEAEPVAVVSGVARLLAEWRRSWQVWSEGERGVRAEAAYAVAARIVDLVGGVTPANAPSGGAVGDSKDEGTFSQVRFGTGVPANAPSGSVAPSAFLFGVERRVRALEAADRELGLRELKVDERLERIADVLGPLPDRPDGVTERLGAVERKLQAWGQQLQAMHWFLKRAEKEAGEGEVPANPPAGSSGDPCRYSHEQVRRMEQQLAALAREKQLVTAERDGLVRMGEKLETRVIELRGAIFSHRKGMKSAFQGGGGPRAVDEELWRVLSANRETPDG